MNMHLSIRSIYILQKLFMIYGLYLIDSYYLQWPFSMLALEGVCMWSGFVTCTYYVWKIKVSI